jgi:integrase/recombinase XerC
MHLRRTVLRLLFRVGRELGLCDGDPTLDLTLPAKTVLPTRPLDNEEIALCRNAALHTLTSTRLAAAWALAEATARTAELPRLTLGNLDLGEQRVWIHGGGRTEPRWGHLSPWAETQLRRHIEQLPSMNDDQPLVYRGAGSAASKQASACMVISEVLTRAGLSTECDVRPLSVAAWAGRTILDETGRIDEVARRLGMRSLDRAAALVGLDWQNR